MASDLTPVREGIDKIDNTILELLKERLSLAKKIGQLKDEDKRAKWDPLRERQIYERLAELNNGVFPDNALHSIFHEIIPTCRLSQQKINVSYLGPEATFTHLAGVKYFGHSATYTPMESIADVFSEVEKAERSMELHPLKIPSKGQYFRPWIPLCSTVPRSVARSGWKSPTTWYASQGISMTFKQSPPMPNPWPNAGSG